MIHPVRLFTVWNRFNDMIWYDISICFKIWSFFIIAEGFFYLLLTRILKMVPPIFLLKWIDLVTLLSWAQPAGFRIFLRDFPFDWRLGRLDFSGGGHFFPWGFLFGRWLWDLWPCCSVPLRWGSNGNDDFGSSFFFKCFNSYIVRCTIS